MLNVDFTKKLDIPVNKVLAFWPYLHYYGYYDYQTGKQVNLALQICVCEHCFGLSSKQWHENILAGIKGVLMMKSALYLG